MSQEENGYSNAGVRCGIHVAMHGIEKDADEKKGAIEQDSPEQETNTTLAGQLPHRNENPLVKSRDTDFPEPGENPEHSGEPEDGGLTSDYRKPA